jgi:hypothetical protein
MPSQLIAPNADDGLMDRELGSANFTSAARLDFNVSGSV